MPAVASVSRAPAAREFHVSHDTTGDGDGSSVRPWDLATALGQRAAVAPGCRILLQGGTYRAPFSNRLTGTAAQRIVVQPKRRDTKIVCDCNAPEGKPRLFAIEGAFTDYRGFEINWSDPRRSINTTGSLDLDRGGVS